MPSHLAAAFKGDWRVEMSGHGEMPLLVHVIQCHLAWNALTKPSRAALLRLAQDQHARVHPQTREALERHGLLEVDGGPVTKASREIVRFRPDRPEPSREDTPA